MQRGCADHEKQTHCCVKKGEKPEVKRSVLACHGCWQKPWPLPAADAGVRSSRKKLEGGEYQKKYPDQDQKPHIEAPI